MTQRTKEIFSARLNLLLFVKVACLIAIVVIAATPIRVPKWVVVALALLALVILFVRSRAIFLMTTSRKRKV